MALLNTVGLSKPVTVQATQKSRDHSLEQWFSTLLTLQPFNTVPHHLAVEGPFNRPEHGKHGTSRSSLPHCLFLVKPLDYIPQGLSTYLATDSFPFLITKSNYENTKDLEINIHYFPSLANLSSQDSPIQLNTDISPPPPPFLLKDPLLQKLLHLCLCPIQRQHPHLLKSFLVSGCVLCRLQEGSLTVLTPNHKIIFFATS